MNKVYLLLGSNEGDSRELLAQARQLIDVRCGKLAAASACYLTAAWGKTDQPDFLNQVVMVETTASPTELLAQTQQIEQEMGRQRTVKWGQRTLDIDILLYGDTIINTPELTIPHPFMHLRRFTLVPLAEVAPMLEHPVLHQSIVKLLENCPDELPVRKA